jgi:hypothetical protein
MLHWLVGLLLLLTAADHWTTWICLRAPVDGWIVNEANPIADWLFARFGLVPGLALDTAITLVAVGVLIGTQRFSERIKIAFFVIVAIWTAHAVINNLLAIRELGLSLAPVSGV